MDDIADQAEKIIAFREMLRETVILTQIEQGDRAGERPSWASVEEWEEITEMANEAKARFYQ
ncbi:MAG: hypothetical protein ACTHX0_14085 [Brachybacterium sp.]